MRYAVVHCSVVGRPELLSFHGSDAQVSQPFHILQSNNAQGFETSKCIGESGWQAENSWFWLGKNLPTDYSSLDFGGDTVLLTCCTVSLFFVQVVTRWYRAPEILLGCAFYDCSIDIWSVACIIVGRSHFYSWCCCIWCLSLSLCSEMGNKKPLFPGDYEIDQLHRIFR